MRLNPFAFPSDTTFRFLLFIVAIVGVSLIAFEWVYGVLFTDPAAFGRALLACRLPLDGVPSDAEPGGQQRLPGGRQRAASAGAS